MSEKEVKIKADPEKIEVTTNENIEVKKPTSKSKTSTPEDIEKKLRHILLSTLAMLNKRKKRKNLMRQF